MADVPKAAKQQTPEEMRRELLAQLDANKELLGELDDNELDAVSGSGFGGIMTAMTMMMGGGSLGGTGIGSTAANQHANTVFNHNDSTAASSIGNIGKIGR